ncbi:MAG TPA: hypothetical protein V6D22_14725 [Candidatus Obscuribacterales bacterium]
MKHSVEKFASAALVAATLTAPSALAATTVYAPTTTPYTGHVNAQHHYYHKRSVTMHDYFACHPKVRAATMGAGIGTAAGAVTGLVTGRGVLRGAVIGAGSGAGVGLVRSSRTMRRHPIVKDVATGSLVGWGLGYAGGTHHGTAGRATAVGAAAGLATGLLTHGL